MLRKKLSSIIVVALITNLASTPLSVFAETTNVNKIIEDSQEIQETNKAEVSKFTPYYSQYKDAYDKEFKMDNSNIESITSTGGSLRENVGTGNIIDGSLDTYWETGRHTSNSFTNELIFTLREETVLNRIAYRSAWNTVGFAEDFEIWASDTEEGNDFNLVASATASKTADVIEIKFNPTNFKRIKFVFKNNGTATASEMMFYKEDSVLDKMNSIFTDSTLSAVSEEFNTIEGISALEEEAKLHPLYEDYKDSINNAKALIRRGEVQAVEATVSNFGVSDEKLQEYNEQFKISRDEIIEASNTGGTSNKTVIENVLDGDLNTFWESGKVNTSTYNNEVNFEFDEIKTINRIVYSAKRGTNRGFAQEFEIYASPTTVGDTFELISTGEATATQETIEIKFEPTEIKRIKFVYKKSVESWAAAAEFGFYKEDTLKDKVQNLFTDSTMSTVSEEFNTVDKVNALEEEFKSHILYEDYKENFENARVLLQQGNIEATEAKVSKFETYYSDYIEAYDEAFRMDNSNIESITSSGGSLRDSVGTNNIIDDNLETYWETGKHSTDSFKNEITFTLEEATVLNRIAYRSAWNTVGFAEDFEIWASSTTKGDTFQLVTSAQASKTADVIEIKFNPTNFKRIKFVFKNNGNATISEMMFYKEDSALDNINSMFTDNTFSEVVEEFNTIEKINELEKEIENHPLKNDLQEKIDLAKSIINKEVDFSKNIFTLKQQGDIVGHIRNDLKMSSFGTNLQSTGIVAIPGEVFKVYVEVEDGKPLPQIVFTQQEGNHSNWQRVYNLNEGMNVITVPEIYDENWSKKSNKGGAVYLLNPYTEEEQGKAPVVRIEGGEHFPLFNEGDDVGEFLEELKAYKEKLDANSDTMVDIFEFNAYRLMFTGTASAAYKVYVNEGVDVNESINVWDEQIELAIKLAGLSDDSEDIRHNSTNIRTTIRLMQPFGAAYAASNHIGLQRGVMDYFLRTDDYSVNDIIWGTMHEVGHQLEIKSREWGEVTNNMWANYCSILNGKSDRINYEDLYKVLAPEDKKRDSESVILEMFWQLQLADENYWPNLERLYRENNPSVPNYQTKKDILAKYSSEILGVNLTPYFEKYNFTLSDECKAELAKYPEMDKKLWYLNTTAMSYTGNGFNDNAKVEIKSIANNEESGITLTFNIDEENKEDLLGYEIIRDGKVVGFTTTNTFTDSDVDINENYTYEVVAYARNLSTSSATEIQSKSPVLLQNEKITLKLNEEFNPLEYVNAFDYLGSKIDNITVNHNVDTSKKGTYNVNYEVVSNDITVTKNATVEVVSDYSYLSDSDWESATTGYGTIRKNNDLKLFVNGEVKSFEKGFGIHANGEIVYDLSENNYDKFEAYVGVSRSIPEQNNSSIIFSILADGNEIYNSGLMKYNTAAKYVSLDVKGVKELRIVINDAGNGISSDHGVIANPILTSNNVKPVLEVGKDEYIKLRSEYNLRDNVIASDIEDGDLTNSVIVNDNGFTTDKAGEYTIEYLVTDSDGNTTKAEKKVLVYSESNYLSDMSWESAVSGWKSVNKDSAVNTTNKIKLNIDGTVKEFDKGIGAATDAEIVYNLNGDYNVFTTYLGTDKNYDLANTTIIFRIFADGEEVYTSDVIRRNSNAEFIRLDVTGVKELKLVADDAGDGGYGDFASWADTKVYSINSKPELVIPKSMSTILGQPIDINQEYSATDIEDGDLTGSVEVEGTVNFDKTGEYPITYTVVDSDGNEVVKTRTIAVVDMNDFTYLTDFDWKSESHSYAAPNKDISISSKTLRLTDESGKEVAYTRGIGSHSNSTIIYDLSDKNYDYFTAYIGVDRNMYGTIGSVSFEVYVDGEKMFDSGLMNSKDPQKYIQVDINGAKELKLVVTDGGNGNGSDHATWGDTKLHYANENGASINREALDSLIKTVSELDSSIYTEETFNNLNVVLEEVKTNLADGYNQEEIDNLYNNLKEAYDELVKVTDFSNLEEVIANNSNLNELHYYKDAITAHNALIEEAKEILANENSTQEEIDAIITKINESSKNLVVRENKVELEKTLEEARAMENKGYQEVRWQNFLYGIDYASNIYNNQDATDEEVRSALFTLGYFKDELK